MKATALAAALAALTWAAPAAAQHDGHGHQPAAAAWPPPKTQEPCDDPLTLRCAAVATPAFAPDGSLWVAWVHDGRVRVARSPDRGSSFTPPVVVNADPADVDDNGENRPKLVFDRQGRAFVTYTVRAERPFSGTVMFARSLDGGTSFEAPRPISDEARPVSQRFDVIGVAPSGRLYVAWIDKRGLAAAKKAGKDYRGAALAIAWSDDGGASFSPNRIAFDHSCECCRVAMAFGADGRPALMWRHVFAPNIRDHAVAILGDDGAPGPLSRVSDDDWAIDACPHHGPALAAGMPGVLHAVWFTDGKRRKGLFYARSEDGGRSFGPPMPLGSQDFAASHAHVMAIGSTVAVAWKEFDGRVSGVMVVTSPDGGRSWTAPARVATAADASDHPLLVADGRTIFLSWLARREGYRLLPVAHAAEGR